MAAAVRMDPQAIPAELRALDRWVVWRWVDNDTDKPDKEPICPRTGKWASNQNSAHWASFDEAWGAYDESDGGYAGVWFAMSDSDDYIFLDFDNVRTLDGKLTDATTAYALRSLSSYAEVSPSGRGVHIICRGRLPFRSKKTAQFEAYGESYRFVSFTGHVIAGRTDIATESADKLADVTSRMFPPESIKVDRGAEITFTEGGRNDGLTRMAGYLRRAGLSPAIIADTLQAANTAQCRPPLPDREVAVIAKSAAGWAPPELESRAIPEDGFFLHAEGLSSQLKPIRWLVRGALMSQAINYLGGGSFVGKSLLAIDWHLHVAWGQDWQGHRVKPATVFYLAQEGRIGIPLRMQAWGQTRGIDAFSLPFYVSNQFAYLLEDTSTHALANHMRELAPEGDIAVVVDTQAASMPGKDESGAGDASDFLTRLRTILVDQHEMTVTVLHHTPKSDPWQLRGSGAIRATAEVVCMLGLGEDNRAGLVTLRPDKLRDGRPLPEMWFQPISVPLLYPGTDTPLQDEDGIWESSAILKVMDEAALAQYRPGKEDNQTREVLEVIHKYPGSTQRAIRVKAGMRIVELVEMLNELTVGGLIEDRGTAGKSSYFLTEAGQIRLDQYHA